MKLLVSPHDDDCVLFASWTVLEHRPEVWIVYDSYVQTDRGIPGCERSTRRLEADQALWQLSDTKHKFLGFCDSTTYPKEHLEQAFASRIMNQTETVTDIWAPAFEEGGHEQHNLVALACSAFEGTCNVHWYLTYTRAGGKSRDLHYRCHLPGCVAIHLGPAVEVPPPSGEAIARKLRALACFKSQMQLDPRLGTAEWFYGNDLREYELLPAKRGEKP